MFICVSYPLFIHSPHRMLILASPRKVGSVISIDSIGPVLPSQYWLRGSYTDANRPWPTIHICIPGLRPHILTKCCSLFVFVLATWKCFVLFTRKTPLSLHTLPPFTNFLHLRTTSSFNFSNIEYKFARPLHVFNMFMHETVLAAYADHTALCPCSPLHFSVNGIRLGCVTPPQLHFPLPNCVLIHGNGLNAFHA